MSSPPTTFLRVWSLVVALAMFVYLGSTPLIDADEGRNAEVAREMAETNDYVVPRLAGMPYLDKPIVYFAAEAAMMELLGPTELAARLPSVIFTLLTALLVFGFARRQWGAEQATVAAIAFLSMPLALAFARIVIFDSALTFFMVAAILAFHRATEASAAARGRTRESWQAAFVGWVAIGMGILTKGPVAIIVPLIVAIPYAIRRRAAASIWSWSGFLAAVVVVSPWVWAVSREVPDFLRYVLVTETAQRLTTGELKRTGPPWYFLPYVLGGGVPWSIIAFFDRKEGDDERENHARVFLLLWILVPLVFFSLSQSKRPQYILPVMPAIALLVARMWHRPRLARGLRAAGAVILVLGCILASEPLLKLKMKPEVAAGVRATALPMGLTALAAGAAGIALAQRRKEMAFAALTLPIVTLPVLAQPLLEGVAQRRSAKTVAERMAPHVRPGGEVIGLQAYSGSLQFYLRRPVAVVTPDAEEFTSNYIIRRYDRFASDFATPVRRPSSLRLDPADVYVIRVKDRHYAAMLEGSGFRKIAEGARFAAYGSD